MPGDGSGGALGITYLQLPSSSYGESTLSEATDANRSQAGSEQSFHSGLAWLLRALLPLLSWRRGEFSATLCSGQDSTSFVDFPKGGVQRGGGIYL